MPYTLIGADGSARAGDVKGLLGGHRRERVYGRLDCPTALSLIRRGRFKVEHRVFFATEADAVGAGYRPCGSCMRTEYRAWKESQLSASL